MLVLMVYNNLQNENIENIEILHGNENTIKIR